MDTKYLSCADTAKYVRKALAKSFPHDRFSVRSERRTIRVNWDDGPRREEVEPIAKAYASGGFDGMIDMAYSRSHYLRSDGSVYVHHDEGTQASIGYAPPVDNRELEKHMPDDVQVVRFGADFVFCNRHISDFDNLIKSATEWLYSHCVIVGDTGNPNFDMFGNLSIRDLARNLVYDSIKGEDWQVTFDRRYS